MTLEDRYELIKSICSKNAPTQDDVGQLPFSQKDIDDEMSQMPTHLETSSQKWEDGFIQNLIFGS